MDTGASFSCITEEALTNFNFKYQSQKYVTKLYLADGSRIVSKSKVILNCWIKGACFKHTFVVVPKLSYPIVIGTDFLTKFSAKISFSNTQTHPVRATKDFTIPPGCEKATTGQIASMFNFSDSIGTCDNLLRCKSVSYFVHKALVSPTYQNKCPIVLLNASNAPIKIRRGEILAVFQIQNLSDFEELEPSNLGKFNDHKIPAHLSNCESNYNTFSTGHDSLGDKSSPDNIPTLNRLMSLNSTLNLDNSLSVGENKYVLNESDKSKLDNLLEIIKIYLLKLMEN